MTKLTHKQRAVMAAVLGVSNCGQDSLFRGNRPSIRPEHMKRYHNDVSAESIAWDFCNHFCETEEMAEYHIDEVKSWEKIIRKMSVEQVRKTWPDYSAFLDATGD